MPVFSRTRWIRFSDCDPAGIVFYPQYFVMFNDLLEEWTDANLHGGLGGYILRRRLGMPTVNVQADFKGISRMGDEVCLGLAVTRIGSRSFQLEMSCHGSDGKLRMSSRQTIVTTSLETHAAVAIPADLLAALQQQAGSITSQSEARV